jgi:hypothetical protein
MLMQKYWPDKISSLPGLSLVSELADRPSELSATTERRWSAWIAAADTLTVSPVMKCSGKPQAQNCSGQGNDDLGRVGDPSMILATRRDDGLLGFSERV